MKTVIVCTLLICCTWVLAAERQTSTVVDRGPNYNVTSYTTETTLPDGQVIQEKHEITELAAGLNYLTEKGYVPSEEVFEPHANGSVALRGQIKVAVSANLNTRGAIQIVGEDGALLTANVLGVAYTTLDGESVLVSSIQDTIGEIVGPNQVIFRNCLTDGRGDIRLTYTRNGFEQDVILYEAFDPPSAFGFKEEETRLEVWTELLNPAPATVTTAALDSVVGQDAKEPVIGHFKDSTIHFGSFKFGQGRAFDLQGIAPDAVVGKSIVETQGRSFLVEAIEFPRVAGAIANLPKPQANISRKNRDALLADNRVGAKGSRPFPQTPKAAQRADLRPMKKIVQAAQVKGGEKGLVLDYIVTLTTGVTNFTFKADGTYSITGPCLLYGSNVIMGGSVTKFASIGSNPYLEFNGSILCDTTPWHMAVFTANTDSTMGDAVASGSPTGYYASTALRSSTTVPGELHDLRISYAGTAIKWFGSTNRISNIQLVNCSTGIYVLSATNVPVHNILATNVATLFAGNDTAFDAEHVTANVVGTLSKLTGNPSALGLTNSILVNVTNAGTNVIIADYVATNGPLVLTNLVTGFVATNPVFTSMVGASHYLTATSSLRQIATTNISPRLFSDLAALTTWAPTSMVNITISNSTVFTTNVLRDSGAARDMGYHYAPIDYVVCGVKLTTNVLLTITNGAVMAVDFKSSSWGLIFDTAKLSSIGSPMNLNRIIRAHNVQETGTGNPFTRAMLYDLGADGLNHGNSEARFRFNEIVDMASDGYMLYTGKHWSQFECSHCQMFNRSIIISATKGSQLYAFTNNVIEWGSLNFSVGGSSSIVHLRNNLFRNFRVDLVNGTTNWSVKNNLFDNTGAYDSGINVANANNAYYPTTVNRLGSGVGNLILSNLSYETGPLSRYYQPSNSLLANAGSGTADQVGLFHFTSSISQIPETNSVVDVGPHFVALGANGQPLDWDNDLLWNIYEDPNGNGIQDLGETSLTIGDSDNDGLSDGAEVLVFHSDPLDAYSGNRSSNGRTVKMDREFYVQAPIPGNYVGAYQAGDTRQYLILTAASGGFNGTVANAAPGSSWDVYLSLTFVGGYKWALFYHPPRGQTSFFIPNPGGVLGFFEAFSADDTDRDGLTDGYEALIGTDPGNPDTDGDGLRDDWEVKYGLNPHGTSGDLTDANGDLDGDGLSNAAEFQQGTNPAGDREAPGPSSRRTGLTISEIMYAPPGGDNYEFIEIYNSQPFTEDLTGYGIVGTGATPVLYTFPTTIIGAQSYIVIAKVPGNIQAPFGNVIGAYSGNLPNDEGTLLLTNRLGAVLLEAKYSSASPYPASAAGGGHSLVLTKPSYGERSPEAWGPSDKVGGSPGQEDMFTSEIARNVMINELRANGPTQDTDNFIELYNHSSQAVDISGYKLSDGTHTYTFPSTTTLSPGGFLAVSKANLGVNFVLSSLGGSIFFQNPTGTRVIDGLIYAAQDSDAASGRPSMGRFPDGAPYFGELSFITTPGTPGYANSSFRVRDILINEIMYHPITDRRDEYIELFNKSATPCNLQNWTLAGDISFTFPNVTIPANGYIVVAYDVATLLAHGYSTLNTGNTIGSFTPNLPNDRGRLILKNAQGVVFSEVRYGSGGRWGKWSDNGGSSLELIDSRSDTRLASNWADSDETAKSVWFQISKTDSLDLGYVPDNTIDFLEVILLGEGECLLDKVQVNPVGGQNLLSAADSDFETGIGNWSREGDHELSTIELATAAGGLGGYNGGQSLHIRTTGRGDYLENRLRVPLNPPISLPAVGDYKIQARVRWLRGHPEIVLRLRGSYLEAGKTMNLQNAFPPGGRFGTPGAKNSVTGVTNPNSGPAIFDVSHSPLLPAANSEVKITARVQDPDGLASGSPVLRYRVDPLTTDEAPIQMRDDGTGGDSVAGDGLYTATIPAAGKAVGTVVAFRVEATDANGSALTSRFPVIRNSYSTNECLIRWGERKPSPALANYRFWMTTDTVNRWNRRAPIHNGDLDLTFIYNNERVIYNIGGRYNGSAPNSKQYDDPVIGKPCGYSFSVPVDDPLLGGNSICLERPNAGDPTGTAEQIAYWMQSELGVPGVYRKYIRVIVNGQPRPGVIEDTQQPDSDLLDSWYGNEGDGDLHKLELWWNALSLEDLREGTPEHLNASLQKFPATGDADQRIKARYRWNWEKRSAGNSASDYDNLFALIEALYTSKRDIYWPQMEHTLEMEEWARALAIMRLVFDDDAYAIGPDNGHNAYIYKSKTGKWRLVPYDMDSAFVFVGARQLNTDLFEPYRDPVLPALMHTPAMSRAYYRAIYDAVNGPMLSSKVDSKIDERFSFLLANGLAQATAQSKKGWISTRKTVMQGLLNAAFGSGSGATTFAISTPGGNVTDNPIILAGTAPVQVKTIKVNGVSYPVTWTSITAWKISVPLINANQNLTLSLTAFDTKGNQVGLQQQITVNYISSNPYLPGASPVINEWMIGNTTVVPNPVDGTYGSWIEIYNPWNQPLTFDNYVLEKVPQAGSSTSWSVPSGTSLEPGGFLLVWADLSPGDNGQNGAGGDLHAGFTLAANDIINLYMPDGSTLLQSVNVGTPIANVSRGFYPDGRGVPANMYLTTPRIANIDPATLPATPNLRINEWMPDNPGWIELYNSGTSDVELTGYSLSKDTGKAGKWSFPPGTSLPAGGYMLLIADNREDLYTATSPGLQTLHLNFTLNRNQDSIALFSLDGTLIDSVAWNGVFAGQVAGTSQGKCCANGGTVMLFSPDPMATYRTSAGSANNCNCP